MSNVCSYLMEQREIVNTSSNTHTHAGVYTHKFHCLICFSCLSAVGVAVVIVAVFYFYIFVRFVFYFKFKICFFFQCRTLSQRQIFFWPLLLKSPVLWIKTTTVWVIPKRFHSLASYDYGLRDLIYCFRCLNVYWVFSSSSSSSLSSSTTARMPIKTTVPFKFWIQQIHKTNEHYSFITQRRNNNNNNDNQQLPAAVAVAVPVAVAKKWTNKKKDGGPSKIGVAV